MEEKQLNFNRPLLSVRRYSAPTVPSEADEKRKTAKSQPRLPPLPAYKSELKSGPVRNPGTVPFIWEQIPGRPKDESVPKNEGPLVAPKLPPGRASRVKKQGLDKGSKGTTAAHSQTGNVLSSSQNTSALERKVATKDERSKEEKEETTSPEDGDETYLDTLSRTESAYMNCSVSGLSGLDGPDIIPYGIFFTDPQARDFMMDRFLPAAKAMASETPHNAPRKQPVAREQPISREEPRRVKKVVTVGKWHQLNQYGPLYVRDIAGEASEDEGMRMPVQVPISLVPRVRGNSSFADSQAKKKYAGSDVYKKRLISGGQEAGLRDDNTDLKSESNQISDRIDGLTLDDGSSVNMRLQGSGISPYRRECSQSVLHDGKCFLGIPDKSKSSNKTSSSDKHRKGLRFLELLSSENGESEADLGSPVVEKTLYVDSVQTVKSSSSNSFSSDIKGEIRGLIIDYRRNNLDTPERSGEMEETPVAESSFQNIEHLGDVNEKAVVQSKCLDPYNSSFLPSSDKSTGDVQKITGNGSLQDKKNSYELAISKVANQEEFNLESQQLEISDDQGNCHCLTQECDRLTSVKLVDEENTDLDSQQRKTSGTGDISHGLVQNSITSISSKVARRGKIDLESQRFVKLGNQGNSQVNSARLPLGPPLPKSPSESWLKRTLPTISSRNSSSQSSLGSRLYTSSPVSKISSLDPKWETIVKTSNVHHGRSRFSEELLTPIPEA